MTTPCRSIVPPPLLSGVLLSGVLLSGVLLSGVLLSCGGKPGSAGDALVGVTVIDGRGNPPVPGRVVVIRDGRIAEIVAADGWTAPSGVRAIALPGRYVMPGLIDLHAHVTVLPVGEDAR